MPPQNIDNVTKIFLVAFVVAAAYLVLSIIIRPLFVQQPETMYGMMQQAMGFSQQGAIPNMLALVAALGLGILVSLQFKTKTVTRIGRSRERALSIVRKRLSGDEKRMLKEIERAGSITQDSLRARLAWSKAKVSTTLTRFDKMNLIQRERQGKTYRVFLPKDLK